MSCTQVGIFTLKHTFAFPKCFACSRTEVQLYTLSQELRDSSLSRHFQISLCSQVPSQEQSLGGHPCMSEEPGGNRLAHPYKWFFYIQGLEGAPKIESAVVLSSYINSGRSSGALRSPSSTWITWQWYRLSMRLSWKANSFILNESTVWTTFSSLCRQASNGPASVRPSAPSGTTLAGASLSPQNCKVVQSGEGLSSSLVASQDSIVRSPVRGYRETAFII